MLLWDLHTFRSCYYFYYSTTTATGAVICLLECNDNAVTVVDTEKEEGEEEDLEVLGLYKAT